MNKISKLNQLIADELEELKLVLLEEKEYQIKPYVDELASKVNSVNKGDLGQIEAFKVFLVYFYLTNNNVLSFDEAFKMVSEIKNRINSWYYAGYSSILMNLVNTLSTDGSVLDNKAFDYMTELGITPEFVNYDMRNVYLIMVSFLKFKRDITDVNLRVKGLADKIRLTKQIFNKSQMKDFIAIAIKALKDSDEQTDYRKKVATEKIKYTQEVQGKVDDLSILSLDDMPVEWHHYLEVELLEEIYNIIFDNLDKREKELQSQIKIKETIINKTPLTKYLYSYGIDVNSIDSSLLETLENWALHEDIIKILDFLRNLGLSLNTILTEYSRVLLELTNDKVNKIQFLLTAKVLSKKTLLNNLELLGSEYNELIAKYEILKEIMDFGNIFYDDHILLKDIHVIKNILSVLGEYDLSKNNYIYLLCHFNYISLYDLMLEHEIPLYLFISICETIDPCKTIKRILIYREIGENFETERKLLSKEVSLKERCLIPDESLDEYLMVFPSLETIRGDKISKVKNDELVKSFDANYRFNHDTYMIGGTLISRPKFLRNFESKKQNRDSVVPCLVSDSLLSEVDFIDIVKEINGKRL